MNWSILRTIFIIVFVASSIGLWSTFIYATDLTFPNSIPERTGIKLTFDGENVGSRDTDLLAGMSSSQSLDSKLLRAAVQGEIDSVKRLLNLRADVNARDNNGNIPLIGGVISGNLPVVQLLLDKEAGVNARNNDRKWGATPTPTLIWWIRCIYQNARHDFRFGSA